MRDTEADKFIASPESVDALDAWSMIESSPDGMLLTDERGRVLLANTRIEKLFGLKRRDLVGQPIEVLLPERFRGAHLAHRTRYRAAPAVRAMGTGLALFGLRRDGTEFPVEVSLSPVDRDGRLRIVATVRDVSDRMAVDAHMHAVLDTVDAATDGVFMFDPQNLCFRYVNRGAVDQLGYNEAELLTMTPLHIKPEFTRSSFLELLEPLLAGAVDSHTFTTVHRRKDGTDVPVEVILEYPPARRPGEHRLMVALVRNISDRLAAELEYRQTLEAFRAAFDRAPVAVSLATIHDDDDVRLASVNEAYGRLLGYRIDELVGRSVEDFVAEPDRDRVRVAARRAARGEVATGAIETEIIRADGSTVTVWAHSSILEGEDDEPTTVLTHVIDLTERQQVQRWTQSLADIRAAVLDDRPTDEILALVAGRARVLTGARNAFVTRLEAETGRQRVIAVDRPETSRLVPESADVDESARRALAGETCRVAAFEFGEGDGGDEDRSGAVSRIDTAPEASLLYVIGDGPDAFSKPQIALVEALAAETTSALGLTRARQERARLALFEDRERMAHDFHDLVIQRLFAAGMSLHSVQGLASNPNVVERVDKVIGEIDQAITELRTAIFKLTVDPSATPGRRLTALVIKSREWLGFEPALRVDGDPDAIPAAVLEQLMPALNEMLSNVARHADADHVEVVVAVECERTTLRVADNGIGFDGDLVTRSGLTNLEARARRLGGTCTIASAPGAGTTITWAVPLL